MKYNIIVDGDVVARCVKPTSLRGRLIEFGLAAEKAREMADAVEASTSAASLWGVRFARRTYIVRRQDEM